MALFGFLFLQLKYYKMALNELYKFSEAKKNKNKNRIVRSNWIRQRQNIRV